jgi:hypothetical protein
MLGTEEQEFTEQFKKLLNEHLEENGYQPQPMVVVKQFEQDILNELKTINFQLRQSGLILERILEDMVGDKTIVSYDTELTPMQLNFEKVNEIRSKMETKNEETK